MSQVDSSYTLSTTTELVFTDAVARVREELAERGIRRAVRDRRPGNAEAEARRRSRAVPDPRRLQPAARARARSRPSPSSASSCPATSSSTSTHGKTHIAAVDAEQMLSIVGNDELAETATEVRRRLATVVERAASA